jgi:hypothetical protein
MKVSITKLKQSEVLERFPIADRVPGWFFRLEELSAGAWIAEGTDLWGRKVTQDGHDERILLESCCEAARRINSQLADSSLDTPVGEGAVLNGPP